MRKERELKHQSGEETPEIPPDCAILEKGFRLDLTFWVRSEPRIALRVLKLIEEIIRTPFHGSGKPEPLKYDRHGLWARRITEEHRLTYYVVYDRVYFSAARYHYR